MYIIYTESFAGHAYLKSGVILKETPKQIIIDTKITNILEFGYRTKISKEWDRFIIINTIEEVERIINEYKLARKELEAADKKYKDIIAELIKK